MPPPPLPPATGCLLDHSSSSPCGPTRRRNQLKRSPGQGIVPGFFEFKTRTQLRCQHCGHMSGPPPDLFRTLMTQIKSDNKSLFPDLMTSLREDFFKAEVIHADCDSATCGGMKREKSVLSRPCVPCRSTGAHGVEFCCPSTPSPRNRAGLNPPFATAYLRSCGYHSTGSSMTGQEGTCRVARSPTTSSALWC